MPLPAILIRGGGDLATGVALRIYRAGFNPIITEVSSPLAVRRLVSFAEAVYEDRFEVEGVAAVSVENLNAAALAVSRREIPVIIDPELEIIKTNTEEFSFLAFVDGRLLKKTVKRAEADFLIGLGPGFTPGMNCDAVVETMRGHTLGRVYWDRPATKNTGLPEGNPARVLRAPAAGFIRSRVEIGDHVENNEVVAVIETPGHPDQPVNAGISGVLRGMIRSGIWVEAGLKIGDVDARGDASLCSLASDKSLAIGGGVLEALLTRPAVRRALGAAA